MTGTPSGDGPDKPRLRGPAPASLYDAVADSQ